MKCIGADVGGTFTDIVYSDLATRAVLTHKVPSTPDDPSLGVMRGITELCDRHGIDPGGIEQVLHGTTVATNALLQHRGALAGMVTTEGYRDVLHIGRHQRPEHYSLAQEIPWQDRPLIRRRHRLGVPERLIPPTGEVLTPLDEAAVRTAARRLAAEDLDAVAVCFLFSYLNPAHERRARAILEEELPGLFVTTSSEVAPQFREFERFTTTAMNAFVGPLVRDYVTRLGAALEGAGIQAELHVMCSNGGLATAPAIAERPVLTLMSGLAAGVKGGAWVGEIAGAANLITLDIGGTSADIGVVTEGRFAEASARDTAVAGYPILVPMIDLHTIGAGGGSIARVDAAGGFKVGPESAGAVPGPAAYGQGGDAATVTDANLVLGRLDADNFLGGGMRLDLAAAERVMDRLAEALGLTPREAAEGTVALLNENMANAIRARTVQKGIDPRAYALVAAGGAGPLHAAEVARLLDIPTVLVPPFPGINSALGLLTTDLKFDVLQTAFLVTSEPDYPRINALLKGMQDELAQGLARAGANQDTAVYERAADARYLGQGYELRVPLPAGEFDAEDLAAVTAAFHRMHEAEYGHSFPRSPIELVNLRVTATVPGTKLAPPAAEEGGTLDAATVKRARVVFRVDDALVECDTAFLERGRLPLDVAIDGPAIVLQTDSTTVVPPGARMTAHRTGVLEIAVR